MPSSPLMIGFFGSPRACIGVGDRSHGAGMSPDAFLQAALPPAPLRPPGLMPRPSSDGGRGYALDAPPKLTSGMKKGELPPPLIIV